MTNRQNCKWPHFSQYTWQSTNCIDCLEYRTCITHWGRVTHKCVGNLTIIGSDNVLSPGRRQAIIWTNAWISLIGPYGTNCNEILIDILTFSFNKINFRRSSAKWRPFFSRPQCDNQWAPFDRYTMGIRLIDKMATFEPIRLAIYKLHLLFGVSHMHNSFMPGDACICVSKTYHHCFR